MLIDQLDIQCFRGISESLTLDFTAPLTVLYAPNGTGKTSICDAVEWVLCGGVGRLGKEESIRCKLGNESLKTTVEANIPLNGNPFLIKRELSDSGTHLFWKDSNCDYTVATDQELLRRFVKALPPSGNSNKAKVDWVRSTRFLESDSLRLLIDSDKASNDTRKLIFSSLFGVAEFQKNELELTRILGKLPSSRTIKSEEEKIYNKIAEYEKLIIKLTSEQTAPYRDHAYNLLNTIAEQVGLAKNSYKATALQNYHKALEISHIQQLESLSQQKVTLDFVRENAGIYQEYFATYEDLNNIINVFVTNQEAVKEIFKKKKIELSEMQEDSQKRENLIKEILEAIGCLNTEKSAWLHLYSLYKNPLLNIDNFKSRTSEISEKIASVEQDISALNEKLLLVDDQIKSLPAWRGKLAELKGINIELNALRERKPNRTLALPLSEQASIIKSELDAMQASRESVLGEIELLLSSGKRYIETHLQDTECPLCEHNHESNIILQKKVSARFSKLASKSKREAELTSKFDEITKLLIQENNLLQKFEELNTKKNELITFIQKASDALIMMGVNRKDISNPEIVTEILRNLLLQYQNSVQKLSQEITPYRSAYDAANKLEELRIRVQSISSLWLNRLEMSREKAFSIDGVGDVLDRLPESLKNKSSVLKLLHEDSKPKIQVLSDEIVKLEEKMKNNSSSIASAKEKITPIHNFIQNFKIKWAIISQVHIINDTEIEKVASRIAKTEQVLNKVKRLFAKTEEYFIKITESEKKEEEYGLYKQEIKEAKQDLKKWDYQAKSRSIVEKEIDLVKKEIMRFISEEIRPLTNIINTLYLRAQGNRFINSIEARPSKEGFLEWIADLNEAGVSFDKMSSLSQGQRQDLALAIFLARARSLGGTFFLDEPLAHLDDLNRVALLDTLRIIVSERRATNPLRLVLTTSSNNLLRHLREKFSLVEDGNGSPALRIYKMNGNPRIGLDVELNELVHSPNKLLVNKG
jgi:exonuclease SbcC